MQAIVDGNKVSVGDYVCFKSDIEQCGKIVKISQGNFGAKLHLHREGGFEGEYLQYNTDTVVDASDCWVE